VRDRSDADDFFRMSDGQLMPEIDVHEYVKSFEMAAHPWVVRAFFNAVDTNLPAWMWPRLGLILLTKGPDGVDYRIIDRHMVSSFTTDQGAQVLRPNWELVNPLVQKIFRNQINTGYVRILTMESRHQSSCLQIARPATNTSCSNGSRRVLPYKAARSNRSSRSDEPGGSIHPGRWRSSLVGGRAYRSL